ncbi:MAG: MYXO-CTERM sorting domain-containing protein [Polyangiaceae bacterium]
MRNSAVALFASLCMAVTSLSPAALAVCKGGAPNGVCEPPDDDCACDDCLGACSGECKSSNPPECTLEDACTCSECWTDKACTDPDLSNCKDNGDCDFFQEGCCCADCAALPNCAGFDGVCTEGTGGTGGAGGGGTGGTGGGGSGGTGTGTGAGGSSIPKDDGGCSTSGAGTSVGAGASLLLAAVGLSALGRRRRRRRA